MTLTYPTLNSAARSLAGDEDEVDALFAPSRWRPKSFRGGSPRALVIAVDRGAS
jgi:hypothetical protein